ncbi:aldose 1-epimerase [Leclercia adecarboxylata]|uniref:aldose 1-epimerase n=1 Tax=Leclercia adecarboxylata TaxID=83655 RepID=UPI002DBF789F|nr:aldose 1-epimerase [Leclercia adecarboxylata]MEB6378712.1 aldose 1-epimerase [Leclercia adecarboxylata]
MMDSLLLQNAHLRMRVNPQGGGLQELFSLVCGQPVLWDGGDSALFPMLPLANRVAGNRFAFQGREIALPQSPVDERFFLHGDGWQSRWQVASHSDTTCILTLRSRHRCGFDYQAELRYQLREHVLHAELMLTHLGQAPMLYGLGFHPWFCFDARSRLHFSASGYWPEGEHHLPLAWQSDIPADIDFSTPRHGGDRWLNVGYSGWNGAARIERDVMSITITAQTPWLMLFRMSDKPFLCLEPQSHPVNAHNMAGQPGLVALGQGERSHFAMAIAVESAVQSC